MEERRFTAELWEHDGSAAWHFVSLPPELADEVEASTAGRAGGFGSVRVEVTVGGTTWCTSLFPDGKAATYVLPVKRQVRLAEGLEEGRPVAVVLRVLI